MLPKQIIEGLKIDFSQAGINDPVLIINRNDVNRGTIKNITPKLVILDYAEEIKVKKNTGQISSLSKYYREHSQYGYYLDTIVVPLTKEVKEKLELYEKIIKELDYLSKHFNLTGVRTSEISLEEVLQIKTILNKYK